MATNRYQGKGIVLQWTNGTGSAVSSGDMVLLGDQGLVAIALQDIANGAAGSVELAPGVVFNFPVKGHNGTANAAVAIYDKVYFTAGEAFCDVDSAAALAGWALAAVTSGETTTVPVLLTRA